MLHHVEADSVAQGDNEDAAEHQAAKGARTRGKAAPVNLPWLMNTTYIQVRGSTLLLSDVMHHPPVTRLHRPGDLAQDPRLRVHLLFNATSGSISPSSYDALVTLADSPVFVRVMQVQHHAQINNQQSMHGAIQLIA